MYIICCHVFKRSELAKKEQKQNKNKKDEISKKKRKRKPFKKLNIFKLKQTKKNIEINNKKNV